MSQRNVEARRQDVAAAPLAPVKISEVASSTTYAPSPARNLQDELAKRVVNPAVAPLEKKIPIGWSLLGAGLLCAGAWVCVGRLLFH